MQNYKLFLDYWIFSPINVIITPYNSHTSFFLYFNISSYLCAVFL